MFTVGSAQQLSDFRVYLLILYTGQILVS